MGAGGASHMITCLLSLSDAFRRENIQTGLSRHEGYSNSLFSRGERKSISISPKQAQLEIMTAEKCILV